MNILFVANEFPDRGQTTTGFPHYLLRVSLSLMEMGHKPYILAGGHKNDKWIDRGIEIIRINDNCIRLENKCLNVFAESVQKSFALNREIKKLSANIKFDIIQFTSLSGISVLYNGKTPSVMRLSSYAKTYFSTYQSVCADIVKATSFAQRMAAKRCNAVYAPCKVTAEAFGKDIHKKVYTIENPFVVDVDEFDMSYVDLKLKNKKYALFFGTLYAEKGVGIIGKSLYRFLDTYKDYYFAFIGDSGAVYGQNSATYLKKCAGEYGNRLIFSNALPHNLLYPVIQNSDFVVLPSLMDNLPNACIEAMYFGKVVIGTDGASFEQLITHRVSGLLCKIGDADDLFDKMKIAVSMDDSEKNKIGYCARKRIEKMKPEIAVNNLIEFYDKVIKLSGRKK